MHDPNQFDDRGFSTELTLPICKAWQSLSTTSEERKKKDFGDAADWALKLWDGSDVEGSFGNQLRTLDDAGVNPPAFLMQINKIAEAMQIFGPSMYTQNPKCHITPTKRPIMGPETLGASMQDPQAMAMYQQFAQQTALNNEMIAAGGEILERVINYSQHELNAERHCHKWIGQSLLAGMGALMTELITLPGTSHRMVGSRWVNIRDVFLDPDAEDWSDMRVVFVRRCDYVWEVEEKFGLPPGVLNKYATHESTSRRGEAYRRKKNWKGGAVPRANDKIEYVECYSKMGAGEKLTHDSRVRDIDMIFGRYVYWAISPNVPWPLNMPSWTVEGPYAEPADALYIKAQWPIPFWLEKDGWPITELYYHEHFEQAWPMGHFRFAKGELEFINWNASFAATKTAVAANTIIAVAKDVSEDIKTGFRDAVGGYNIIDLPKIAGKKIGDVISMMDPPPFNPEIHNSRMIFEQNADKRIGLSEWQYGTEPARQIRSRGEADYREQHATARPSFFARTVDTALARKIRNESFAMRWFLQPQDVAPIVGPLGAEVWRRIITSTPPEMVVREYDFRIEANSSRKPNLERTQDQANQLLQVVMPFAQSVYQQWGDPTLINACFEFWGKAFEYENIDRFMIPDMRQQVQAQQIDQQAEQLRREEEQHQQELRHESEDQQVENRNRLAESEVRQRILWDEHMARSGNGET